MEDQIRSMRMIHIALVIGVALFCVVALGLNRMAGPFMADLLKWNSYLFALVIILSTILLIVSVLKGDRLSRQMSGFTAQAEKLDKFRKTFFIRMALVEAPALLSIIFFMMTGSFLQLVPCLVLLTYMASQHPAAQRVHAALGLAGQ